MRLGVIGTMVWDTIHGRGDAAEPVEEWGGIAYALAAIEAALPAGWEIVPLIKVGRDLADRANGFLAGLAKRADGARFVEVTEPNNRVTLRYESATRRTEKLAGGVPPWTWSELGPMVRDLDVVYLNFISGFELDLQTAQHMRRGFAGPIYADLHSLLLGLSHDGMRFPQALPRVREWFACFDVVQLNEEEMELIGGEPLEIAAQALAAGVRLLVVTLGPRGAAYFTGRPFSLFDTGLAKPGPIRTARVPAPAVDDPPDPTGCGDVFGASLIAQLADGAELEAALAGANAYAARNAAYRGATNLHYHLRGEIVPR
jgi:hypothetical protein